MIGRTIATIGLAGAVTLVPVAAYGYVAPSPDSTQSTSVLSETDSVETLSSTGFESAPMAIGAGILLVAGAATVIVAARRTSAGGES